MDQGSFAISNIPRDIQTRASAAASGKNLCFKLLLESHPRANALRMLFENTY